MSAQSRVPLALSLTAILTLAAAPASAQFTYDTLYVTNSRSAPPSMVAGPDGVLHVIVPEETAFLHFWRQGGTWQQEFITPAMPINPATETSYLSVAVGPANRLAALRRDPGGRLIVLRPGTNTYWDADTIPGVAGLNSKTTPALQLDPATDEPVVVFTVRSPGPFNQLMLARRRPAGWSIVEVSGASAGIGEPALVLDPAGRIHIAVNHNGGPEGIGIYHVAADSVPGPFTWTRADTISAGAAGIGSHPSIVLDPVTGDPRIVHTYSLWPIYASRSAGVWTSGNLTSISFGLSWTRPPSLVFDGAGRPRILTTIQTNVLSTSSTTVDPACSGVFSFSPVYLERDQPTGTDPFAYTFLPQSGSDETSAQSAVWHDGRIHIVWLDTIAFTCWPSRIIHGQSPVVASVPDKGATSSSLRFGPNPIRPGGSLQLRLHAADGPVALDLTDIAGRRVARTDHAGASGEREIRWTLPALRPGWYHVRAKQGATLLGSAPLLIVD